jgi:hypothetical protein
MPFKARAMTTFGTASLARQPALSGAVGGESRLNSPVWLLAIILAASFAIAAAVPRGPVIAAGVVVAVGVAVAVLDQPSIGALCLVTLVPVTSGLRPGFPVPQLRLSEALILGLGTLILLAARAGYTARWRAFDWWALAYVVATAAIGAYDLHSRGEAISGDNLDKLLGPLQFFLLYRAVLTAFSVVDLRDRAIRLLLYASVPISILTLLQQFHIAGVPAFLANATGSQVYFLNTGIPRATGPFAIWHDLGSYLLVIILLAVALLVFENDRIIRRNRLLGIVALAGVALINTVSFTPLLGATAGTLIIARYGRFRGRWLVGLAVFAVVIAVVFGSLFQGRYETQFAAAPPVAHIPYLPETLNFRVQVWRTQYIPLVEQNFLVGIGPALPSNLPFPYTESLYASLLIRGGIALLLIYAGLMVAIALSARSARYDPDLTTRVIASVVFVLTVLLVFLQLSTNYFINAGLPHLFWILAALLFAKAETPGALHWRARADARLRPRGAPGRVETA